MSWLLYAFISAGAAALTAVLAKVGVEGVPSTLATAVRTVVIAVFAWAITIGLKEHHALSAVSRRSLLFLVLSGLATACHGWRTSVPCRWHRRRGWLRSTSSACR
jgi:transporter family protein